MADPNKMIALARAEQRMKVEAELAGGLMSRRAALAADLNGNLDPTRQRPLARAVELNEAALADTRTPYMAAREALLGNLDGLLHTDDAFTATSLTELPGSDGGPADRFRHQYWQGRLTQEYGAAVAAAVGYAHEAAGMVDATYRLATDPKFGKDEFKAVVRESTSDLKENAHGRAAGRGSPDRDALFDTVRAGILARFPDLTP